MRRRGTTRTGQALTVWLTLAALIIAAAVVFVGPYFEAKQFNECTGGSASYWDAFFTELRVTDCKR